MLRLKTLINLNSSEDYGVNMEYITEIINFLRKKLNSEVALCLGYLPENPGSALIISQDGLYLSRDYSKIPEEEYDKYEGVILHTIREAKEKNLPLWSKYLENSEYIQKILVYYGIRRNKKENSARNWVIDARG